MKVAWNLSRGAITSPLHQNRILERAEEWECTIDRGFGNIWDAITLPFALWKKF